MTAAFIGATIGFVIGALGAVALNLELLGFATGAPRTSTMAVADRSVVMRWIMRSLLVVLPVGLAIVGFSQAEAILGNLV